MGGWVKGMKNQQIENMVGGLWISLRAFNVWKNTVEMGKPLAGTGVLENERKEEDYVRWIDLVFNWGGLFDLGALSAGIRAHLLLFWELGGGLARRSLAGRELELGHRGFSGLFAGLAGWVAEDRIADFPG
jgi:hypothetical protein